MDTDGIAAPAVAAGTAFVERWASPRAVAAGTVGAVTLPPSVNYHLWAPCNMRCRFCFAPFQDVVRDVLPKGHLPQEESLELTAMLADRFAKVTFVGGEPTLCPWLPELVYTAKQRGATTMLVTNASRLREVLPALKDTLDWVAISIDSAAESTLVQLGRAVQGRTVISQQRYVQLGELVRAAGMRLKINTVVTCAATRNSPASWSVIRGLRTMASQW